jgi:hypothetical protein
MSPQHFFDVDTILVVLLHIFVVPYHLNFNVNWYFLTFAIIPRHLFNITLMLSITSPSSLGIFPTSPHHSIFFPHHFLLSFGIFLEFTCCLKINQNKKIISMSFNILKKKPSILITTKCGCNSLVPIH